MDFPLVPQNKKNNQDILPLIGEVFQDLCPSQKIPLNLCQNLIKHNALYEENLIKLCSSSVTEDCVEFETSLAQINTAEEEILKSHGQALIKVDADLKNLQFLLLKRAQFFPDLPQEIVEQFNLLQKGDLLPHKIVQYLDFTYNPSLHTCPNQPCVNLSRGWRIEERARKKKIRKPAEDVEQFFRLEPPEVNFHNYELHKTYRRKMRLRNISKSPQKFSFAHFEKTSPFSIKMESASCRLATGMCADFTVVFSPTIYQNTKEEVLFKTANGNNLSFHAICTRDAPKLTCYVFNSLWLRSRIQKPTPDSDQFSYQRWKALNCTIDCGTCLLGDYSLVTLIITNEGEKGSFYITTEQDWMFENCAQENDDSELKSNCFTIYPRFFEINKCETCKLFILFEPKTAELYNETFVIVCDNNTYHELEIVGDCIMFKPNFIKIHIHLAPNDYYFENNKITISAVAKASYSLTVTVTNNSPIFFEYFWAVQRKTEEDDKILDHRWIHIDNITRCLPSYSSSDFIIRIVPDSEVGGTYFSFISIYLKRIPAKCLPKPKSAFQTNENVVRCICSDDDLEYGGFGEYNELEGEGNMEIPPGNENRKSSQEPGVIEEETPDEFAEDLIDLFLNQFTDLHLCKLEIECFLTVLKPDAETSGKELITLMPETKLLPVKARLRFSKDYINFGTVYKGTKICKHLVVENLASEAPIKWRIVEIILKDNFEFYLHANVKHLSKTMGVFAQNGHRKQKIKYSLEAKEPVTCLSALVLLSYYPQESANSAENPFQVDSVCLIIYQVAEIKIGIHCRDSDKPVLSLRQLLYTTIPSSYKIHVHNCGTLTGCFCFLKPLGEDADKLRVKFEPHCGIISPGVCVEVKLHINPVQPGILEDFYVPCFTGDLEKVASLKIVCAITGVNVFFYLPGKNGEFERIFWPPRSDSFVNWNMSDGEGVDDFCPRFPAADFPADFLGAEDGGILETVPVANLGDNLGSLVGCNSIAYTYPTVKLTQIFVKQPKKITFFVENLTPIESNFSVEATNFGQDYDCINSVLVKSRAKNPREVWESTCLNGHGIAVDPETSSGNMVAHEIIQVDVWVYANTWGRYLEEIIVEISDLIPFCFNVLIEVSGSPLEFPFAVHTILQTPTLRFGNLAYSSSAITKTITISNVSSIPINVTWHVFQQENKPLKDPFSLLFDFHETNSQEEFLMILSKNYGSQTAAALDVEPRESWIEKCTKTSLQITFRTYHLRTRNDKFSFRYNIVGFVHIREEDGFKENYFKRKSGAELGPSQLAVVGDVERPLLEITAEESTVMSVFVNDLIFKKEKDPEVYLRFRNADKATILFTLEIEKPFFIEAVNGSKTCLYRKPLVELRSEECLEVKIVCQLSYNDLIQFADLLYKDITGFSQPSIPDGSFVSVISKNLVLRQEGTSIKSIPIEIRLFYPHIEVKPAYLKMGACLLYHTKRAILSVYNLTGASIKFEIYKTSTTDDFEVVPNHGHIPPTTGINKQFVDLIIYFTPTQVKSYVETIKILTNIPQYFVDVMINGYGSNNEKFQMIWKSCTPENRASFQKLQTLKILQSPGNYPFIFRESYCASTINQNTPIFQ